MKSKIIIAGLLCIGTIPPATAVTKCVALNSSTRCTSENPGYNVADWTSTCTTNGVSTPISGIGICSANAGSATGATATELEISSTADENVNCWCRMISPAVSHWVFHRSLGNSCARHCATYCVFDVLGIASLRSALFSSLSD